MKISGPGGIRPLAPRTGRTARSGSGARFAPQFGEEAQVARTRAAAPVGAAAAVLAVQEVPDALDGRSRGLKRARTLLDHLDEIRLALLAGSIPAARLKALHRALAEGRGPIEDARLAALMDEIELRVAVELAKLGMLP